jgi:DNA-3-methyladenine glycosylase
LRTWFGHVPERFAEFAERYRAELAANAELPALAAAWGQHPTVTLLFGAHDEEHNQAIVLAGYLDAGSTGR